MNSRNTFREDVLLVGCALKSSSKAPTIGHSLLSLDESLDELAALTASAGGQVLARIVQERDAYDPATLIGSGKLREVRQKLQELAADLVVFDENLSTAKY
jgi:GTPase